MSTAREVFNGKVVEPGEHFRFRPELQSSAFGNLTLRAEGIGYEGLDQAASEGGSRLQVIAQAAWVLEPGARMQRE